MRLLVIGGTRFIGLSAVNHFVAAGHDVIVFNRGETEVDLPAGVERITGDLWHLSDHATELEALSPDAVVHMMLLTGKQTQHTVEVLAGVTDRLVAISSGDVYRMYARINGTEPGPADPTPVDEDGPLRERHYPYRDMAEGPDDYRYDYDKIEVETAATESDLATTIMRLPMVYGPRDYQRRLWSYHKRMADGRPAILLDTRLTDWRASRCFVDDAGHAIARAATSPSASDRIYNVAEHPAPTELEWVQMIGEVAGWEGDIVPVEPDLLPEPLQTDPRGQDLYMDSTRIRAELGFVEPVTRREAIARTIEWDLAHPPDSHLDPFDYSAEDAVLEALG
ncbi:MAG: NAD-dependent epimerase/dehydratase family protein [Acidimicrobiia bacterium]|nr:NAD-dependent epimerase/dehydratase family protein [Acidimicrobiia bacterium]